MARPFYKEVDGGIFHVTSRGNARRAVFEDDQDCQSFLTELSNTVIRYRWRCLSYCLMGNHFHLLVQTPFGQLAQGMRDLKSAYVRTFNARRGADGSRFKARYWRQLVQEDGYLLAAAVYVAQNPVRAGRVTHPAEWPWSSFAAIVEGAPTLVDAEPILRLLGPDPIEARHRFGELAGAVNGPPAFNPALPIVGDAEFVRRHAPVDRPPRDVVKFAWEQARPSLPELSHALVESEFLLTARVTHRYTLREIAEHLGCSEQTVYRRLRMSGVGTRQG